MELDQMVHDPDFLDQNDQWSRIQQSLELIDTQFEEISRAGGITKTQARALVEDCGVTLSESYPIASYTDQPSQTNLTITMESMGARGLELLGKLVQTAADLLVKIVKWVIDLVKARIRKMRDPEAKLKKVDTLKKADSKLHDAGMGSTVNAGAKEHPRVVEARHALQHRVDQFTTNYSDLMCDVLVDGKFSQLVRSMEIDQINALDILKMKLELFDIVVRSTPNRPIEVQMMEKAQELGQIAEPIRMGGALRNRIIGAGITVPSDATMRQASTAVYQKLQSCEATPATCGHSLGDVCELVSQNEKLIVPYLTQAETFVKDLGECRGKLEHLRRINTSAIPNDVTRERFIKALAAVREDVESLQQYITTTELCARVNDALITLVYDYLAAETGLRILINASGEDSERAKQAAQFAVDLKSDLRK